MARTTGSGTSPRRCSANPNWKTPSSPPCLRRFTRRDLSTISAAFRVLKPFSAASLKIHSVDRRNAFSTKSAVSSWGKDVYAITVPKMPPLFEANSGKKPMPRCAKSSSIAGGHGSFAAAHTRRARTSFTFPAWMECILAQGTKTSTGNWSSVSWSIRAPVRTSSTTRLPIRLPTSSISSMFNPSGSWRPPREVEMATTLAPAAASKPAKLEPTEPKPSIATVMPATSIPRSSAIASAAAFTEWAVYTPEETAGNLRRSKRISRDRSIWRMSSRSVPMSAAGTKISASSSGRIARPNRSNLACRSGSGASESPMTPALAPPNGSPRKPYLLVIVRASRRTSSPVTSWRSRIPPCARPPTKESIAK